MLTKIFEESTFLIIFPLSFENQIIKLTPKIVGKVNIDGCLISSVKIKIEKIIRKKPIIE